VLYILSFGLLQFTIFGFSNQFIWPSNELLSSKSIPFFVGCTTIFVGLFSYKFLNIKALYPKIKIAFFAIILFGIAILVTLIWPSSALLNYIIACVSLLNVLILFGLGTFVWWQGYVPARYYMIAWAFMLLALAIFILKTVKILPESMLSYLILPFGSLIEVIMLSFALGSRLNTVEKDKNYAQNEVLQQLQENEKVRNRIARDLHDDLGSTLSSIHIMSEFAKTESTSHPEKLPYILNKITSSTKNIQENLQDIVWTTQIINNNIDNLLVRIRLFGGEILESKNIDYQIDIDKKLQNRLLNSDYQYDIFMIYKEALNNIVKYAEASKVTISLKIELEKIILNIKDNGIGFDINIEKTGNGLKNMQRRAENLNGKLTVDSKENSGTVVDLEVPVPK
jgi:signal transduction histidine kinase